ncbi:uncharacterized protein IL334_001942 [Kwoniella shivajii]|uniref:Metallo-beta-lactamase domain-containing protein n=1 Tax=Kwoniella shivajii TaxID=564305 RepID=A0ABZ1CWC8_9TREE|nr:hypothetical protein IL334_001942 [Kwoniella shivajii]
MPHHANPWSSYSKLSMRDMLKSLSVKEKGLTSNEPTPISHPVVFPSGPPKHDDGPRVIWLGHASIYLMIPHLNLEGNREWRGILFDPVFSSRCSPISFIGPRRRLDAPSKIKDIPKVDLVIISHDHYDHLDKETIKDIETYHQDVQYMVPTGLRTSLMTFGVSKRSITELGWWEEDVTDFSNSLSDTNTLGVKQTVYMSASSPLKSVSPLDSVECQILSPIKEEIAESLSPISPTAPFSPVSTTLSKQRCDDSVKVVCCPAQHNSGRSLFAKNKTLWATWWLQVRLPDGKVWKCFFGGDTGYRSVQDGPSCPIFKEIKDRYGSPDLALLPIAHGSVLPYLSSLIPFVQFDSHRLTSAVHCSPEDAATIHQDMEAKITIPIHWATWTTEAETKMIVKSLRRACEEHVIKLIWSHKQDDIDVGQTITEAYRGFVVCDIGVSVALIADLH